MSDNISNKILALALCGLTTVASAQKGAPPKEDVTASVVTHFPQHEVFDESMVKRIKVPDGFSVSVAAAGLGKPRMPTLRPSDNFSFQQVIFREE